METKAAPMLPSSFREAIGGNNGFRVSESICTSVRAVRRLQARRVGRIYAMRCEAMISQAEFQCIC